MYGVKFISPVYLSPGKENTFSFFLNLVQCTMSNVQMYKVQVTMYNVQCTNVQGTGYNVQGTGYNVQCTNLEDTDGRLFTEKILSINTHVFQFSKCMKKLLILGRYFLSLYFLL